MAERFKPPLVAHRLSCDSIVWCGTVSDTASATQPAAPASSEHVAVGPLRDRMRRGQRDVSGRTGRSHRGGSASRNASSSGGEGPEIEQRCAPHSISKVRWTPREKINGTL